jgi:exodeoxyribonuclease VII small subunit
MSNTKKDLETQKKSKEVVKDVKVKNFDAAMLELENVVDLLEKGELSLDESIEMFQKGIGLSKFLSKRLDEVERKISVLIEHENGDLGEELFDGGQGN